MKHGWRVQLNNLKLRVRMLFNRKKYRPRKDWDLHTMGRGVWGNHISTYPAGQGPWAIPLGVFGHMDPRPKTGDQVNQPMESGRTRRGTLVVTRYCIDPHDMFMGQVYWHTMLETV